jgi:putative transposase
MIRESRTVDQSNQVDSGPTQRHLPLVDLLVDTRAELMELAVASGLKVLHAMLEDDRTAVCGPRYVHRPNRQAVRAGTVDSEVVFGGRKVAIRRPRVRASGHEVPLPTFHTFADTDPLNRRVVEQMLVGVATRQYQRSLEPTGGDVMTRGTSKSAVSRRFVARTTAQLNTWRSTSLEALDLVALIVDSIHVAEHCVVVALGIDTTGKKHALGLWSGSTENTTVCQSLLANLQSRGLRTDRSLLIILDGSKALHRAVSDLFGQAALIQRCHVHKRRNVLEHLPERQRPWVRAILNRAYTRADVATARRLLHDLARRLEEQHPSAADSVREGLDETLTILSFGISDRLRHSLATTNAIESLLSRTRHVKRNVKRWRSGTMVVRWVAAGILEATKGFRRLQGKTEMPKLVAALRARDQQLGLGNLTENVA